MFLSQVAANAGFFLAVLFLARGLGPAGRGTVAFVTVAASVIAHVAKFGLAEAAAVLVARRPDQRAVLLTNIVLFSTVMAAVGAFAAVAAMLALSDEAPAGVGTTELALLVVGSVAAALVGAGYGVLIGLDRFWIYAAITVAGPWVYALFLGLVWATFGLTISRAIGAWVVAHILWAAMLIAACAWRTGFARPALAPLRESLSFGMRAWAGSLSMFLNFRADQILMGFLATEAALGLYAVAVNVSEVLLYLPGAIATALIPLVARDAAKPRVAETLTAFRVLTVLTIAGIVVAALLFPVLVPIIFGEAFRGSVQPFLWLLPGAIGFASSRVFSAALMALGKPGLSSVGPFASLAIGLILDVILIPPYGAEGAAAAASVAFLLGGATALLAYRTSVPFRGTDLLPRPADVQALFAIVGWVARRHP
ncbi:MAG: oligosaccharide flippase family protein [Actinomycetota bacterium]